MMVSVTDLVNPKDPSVHPDWTAHAPSDDNGILDQLERNMPVRLIATLSDYT